MNKLIWILAVFFGLTACGGDEAEMSDTTKKEQTWPQVAKERVEILYFHGTQRCATCLAIERNAKEAIESQFADALRTGKVVFRTIDISEAENKAIAEKYKVTWSSLFISRWKDGKETYENLTEYAFANARMAPDTFKKGLTIKIHELQK